MIEDGTNIQTQNRYVCLLDLRVAKITDLNQIPETWWRALTIWDETITQDLINWLNQKEKRKGWKGLSGFSVENYWDTVSAS
jgi:hypothetical protein